MANYYEMSRSSYFRVNDKEAFRAFLERFGGAVEMIEDDKGRVGFLAQEGIPSTCMPDDSGSEAEEVDFVSELAGHLTVTNSDYCGQYLALPNPFTSLLVTYDVGKQEFVTPTD